MIVHCFSPNAMLFPISIVSQLQRIRAAGLGGQPYAYAVDGLTLESLVEFIDAPLPAALNTNTCVYPTACCCPMGFSWSSAVGQDVMLQQTRAAGMTDSHLLADDKPCPDFGKVTECHAVCTDDVMHWARSVPIAKRRLEKLDTQWMASGIARRPNKDIDWALKSTALGCVYDGAEGFLHASTPK